VEFWGLFCESRHTAPQGRLDNVRVFGNEFSVCNGNCQGRGENGDTMPYSMEREINDSAAIINAEGGSVFLDGFCHFSLGWKIMCSLAPTLAYDVELSKDFPSLEKFKEMQISTRFLVGSKSSGRNHTVGSQIATVSPNISFQEIAGQDHRIHAKVLLPVFTKIFS
jgi:hypothetical protein